jgi:hypothetical protein
MAENQVEASPEPIVPAASEVGVEAELKSMGDIAKALNALSRDRAALARVLAWVSERYGVNLPNRTKQAGQSQDRMKESPSLPAGEFETLADLFSAAKPTTEADKALVIAYGVQVHEKQSEWTGLAINKELKHLGHGVSNITVALDTLISQKPQLALQTKKSGKARQARKLYKLTAEGLKRVRQMVSTESAGDHKE